MKRKKTLLTMGSILAVGAPIVTVVSCGKFETPSKEDIGLYNDLTSEEAQTILEMTWQEKVIKAQDSTIKLPNFGEDFDINATENQPIKDMAEYYIRTLIAKSPSALREIGKQMLSVNHSITSETLRDEGILFDYEHGDIMFDIPKATISNKGLTANGFKRIYNFLPSKIKLNSYKNFITYNYLTTVTKSQWGIAFPDKLRNLTVLQQEIHINSFLVSKEALSQHLFAKWEVSLNDSVSSLFVTTKKSPIDTLTDMKANGILFKNMKYSETKTFMKQEILNPGNNLDKVAAYKDFSSVSSIGDKSLTDRKELEKMTTRESWSGFEVKNDLLSKPTDEVPYIPEKTSVVDVKYMYGLMPIFKDGSFDFESDAIKNAYAKVFAQRNSGLYSEAMEYYTTTVNNRKAILLSIPNESYHKILVDEKGLKFIDERKPNKD